MATADLLEAATADLLEALSVAPSLDEPLWTAIMLDRHVQSIRLDDLSVQGHIRCIVTVNGDRSRRPNPVFHALLRRTAALLRQPAMRASSRRGPLNALHLCNVCVHFASQALQPADAARALRRAAGEGGGGGGGGGVTTAAATGATAPLEELVDATLELVAQPDVQPQNYEVS